MNDMTFTVDFESEWPKLFARKDSAKRCLYRLGTINEDYITTKIKKTEKSGGHNYEKIMMTEQMHKMIVAASLNRVRHSFVIDEIAGIKILKQIPCVEQNTIGFIFDALQYYKPIREFIHHNYRIDLYFPDHKLAIECDEYGHRYNDQIDEENRETFLKKSLQCSFIRFNPHNENFKLTNVISIIIERLNKFDIELNIQYTEKLYFKIKNN